MTQQPLLLPRRPSHRLFRVLGDGADATWIPIGATWPNKDGQSFSIICDAVPLQGRICLRAITERATRQMPMGNVRSRAARRNSAAPQLFGF